MVAPLEQHAQGNPDPACAGKLRSKGTRLTGFTASVLRKNVVFRLHSRVAREPALGVVPLRRRARRGAGLNVSDAAL